MRRLLLLVLLAVSVPATAPGGGAPRAGRPADRTAVTAWSWPLPPPLEVARGFDRPAERWLAGHRGVDLRGRPRERVLAAGPGTVAFAGRVAGVPVVSVRHPDGLLTTYQPVVASVTAGDEVRRGDRLGRLSERGSHCAPASCLHWGLRRADDYLDPLLLVLPVRVRLLPITDGPAPGA